MRTAAMGLAMALTLTPVAAAQVTLINVFEVPDGQVDQSIEAWEAARDFLSMQPGYISTSLHQSLSPDARFQLINIAQWETQEAFVAATRRMRQEGVFAPDEGLKMNPALYQVVRRDVGQ